MKGINVIAVSAGKYFCKIWERTILCHILCTDKKSLGIDKEICSI